MQFLILLSGWQSQCEHQSSICHISTVASLQGGHFSTIRSTVALMKGKFCFSASPPLTSRRHLYSAFQQIQTLIFSPLLAISHTEPYFFFLFHKKLHFTYNGLQNYCKMQLKRYLEEQKAMTDSRKKAITLNE